MTTRIFNYANTNKKEMASLLTLFRNSSTKHDYMASGEIKDMYTLKKVLSNKNLIHFFDYYNNIPVAYCQVVYKSDSENFRSGAKINALAVLPENRGDGLGKKLLQETMSELQKNSNIKNIYLDVVKDNIIAINLYKEIGFKKVGELRNIFTKDNTLMDIETYSLLVN